MAFELDRELLLKLFRVSSPSNKEEKMREFIKKYLSENNISFSEDTTGNIYKMDVKNAPLLSCHMDTVESGADTPLTKFINIFKHNDKEYLRGYGVIGGDDKCGIYLILLLALKYQVNFVFSVGEEVGCKGIIPFITNHKEDFKNILYGLILDRRGSSDIICNDNNYGTVKFELALDEIGKKFNYKHARGFSSDANHIKNEISCANLSVGYFNPHNKNEFVSLDNLQNVYNFVIEIITTLKERFEPLEVKTYPVYDYKNDYGYGSQGIYISCCICYKGKTNNSEMYLMKRVNKHFCAECAKKIVNEVFENESLWNLIEFKTPTPVKEIEIKTIPEKKVVEPLDIVYDERFDIVY